MHVSALIGLMMLLAMSYHRRSGVRGRGRTGSATEQNTCPHQRSDDDDDSSMTTTMTTPLMTIPVTMMTTTTPLPREKK
jgi:hypothetical protein